MIVASLAEAEAVVARALALVNGRLVLSLAQDTAAIFRDAQKDWFDRRFDKGLTHQPRTIQARASALAAPRVRRRSAQGSYYRRNRPRGAKADHPFGLWTGAIMRSTLGFTAKSSNAAVIDPAKGYRGPILTLENPAATVIESRGATLWNEGAIFPALAAHCERKMREYLA